MGRCAAGDAPGALAVPVIAADVQSGSSVTARCAGERTRPAAVVLRKWSEGARGAPGRRNHLHRLRALAVGGAAPPRRGGWECGGAATRRPAGAARGIGFTGPRGAPRRCGQQRGIAEAVGSATAVRPRAGPARRCRGQQRRGSAWQEPVDRRRAQAEASRREERPPGAAARWGLAARRGAIASGARREKR